MIKNVSVIDVKSLWDMDSQEGSKNAFAIGSKFDHLSPDNSSTLQKKVAKSCNSSAIIE